VILSGTFDQDLTGVDEREGVLTVARFPVSRRRGCGQMVDAGEVLVASGEDGVVDEVQRGKGSSGAWSSGSIASRIGSEGRLETCRAAGCFGFTMPCLISCERNCTEGMRRCARAGERE
jgi:hypothetical protein